MADFSELQGKTILNIKGLHEGSEEVVFTMTDNSEYTMDHRQD